MRGARQKHPDTAALIDALDAERVRQGLTKRDLNDLIGRSISVWWHVIGDHGGSLDTFLGALDALNIEMTLTTVDGENLSW